VEAKTKLSHVSGPGPIHLGKRVSGEMGEDQLQGVLTAEPLSFSILAVVSPGVVKRHGKTVCIAKLMARISEMRGGKGHGAGGKEPCWKNSVREMNERWSSASSTQNARTQI
jgi:hypothetical protein